MHTDPLKRVWLASGWRVGVSCKSMSVPWARTFEIVGTADISHIRDPK